MIHVDAAITLTLDVPAPERSVDMLPARAGGPVTSQRDDLNVEVLFTDEAVVAASSKANGGTR